MLVIPQTQADTEVEKTTSSTNQSVDFEGNCNPIAHVGIVVENIEGRVFAAITKTNAITQTFVAVKTSIIAHGEGVGDATKFSIYSVLRLFSAAIGRAMQRKNKKPKKDFIEVENLEGETREILRNTIGVEAPLAQKVAENSSSLRCGEHDILSRRLAIIVFVNAVHFRKSDVAYA